ncbi:hypothetical protein LT337_32205 (plasmid) [Mycolicibacterium fortuitum]|nr:hypothetical protein LT337_32205 [Mycolicibacterium fortuitum]
MSIDALITAREASYRGEGDWRTPAIYNTVDELLFLRESRYLIGPDARTVAAQKFTAHKDNPHYSHAPPGQGTARHWTAEEIESIRRCYWREEHVARIRQAFPVETAAFDREKWNLQVFNDPELCDIWDEPGDIGRSQAQGEHR